MDKTIEIAKCTLADLFNFQKIELDRKVTRKGNVIEARRFLIYFLVNELNFKFINVPKVMGCITSHATAMHHFYKMMDLLELEEKTRLKYINFKNQMLEKGMDKLEIELHKQFLVLKEVKFNIKQLKDMIDEA
tara:strand:+ start:1138 stop:1536 length:399 start_codon:yes stop_codon:yes gene_type:complete